VDRWGGAVYLIWLGLRVGRAAWGSSVSTVFRADAGRRDVFWHGVLIALANPETSLFYAAFFPQFVRSERSAVWQ
jgi:homoserine/homoserine lactone efflux protein